MNPHNLEAISSNHKVPEAIAESISAWRMFTEWAYTFFQPSRETQAKAFLNFAYSKGGMDAVKWLAKHRYIAKPIVRQFMKELQES